MGAQVFYATASGKDLNSAFRLGVEEAQYEYGHGGYTGSMAEKGGVKLIDIPVSERSPDTADALPTYAEAEKYADKLIEACDPRIDDKWGPAGAIQYQPTPKPTGKGSRVNKHYLFFGWASS